MKRLFLIVLSVLCLITFTACSESSTKKYKINDNTSFDYSFVDPPKVGDVIMKVSVTDQEKRQLKVFAQYDMPSMRGHHASGKVEFKRNQTQDYVLPIHFAMPGDWEIILIFEEDGKELHKERVNLNI